MMAALTKLGKNLVSFEQKTQLANIVVNRCFSKSCALNEDKEESQWLPKWIAGAKGPKQSHSSLLSDKKEVYELQVHSVKPDCMEDYLSEYQRFVEMMSEKTGAQITGSWTVEIGDQDNAIHLWKFPGGYPVLNSATEIYRTDKDFSSYRKNRNTMLRERKNEILLPFKFWGEIQPREGKWIYELRSYSLKHGNNLAWGSYWSDGIKYRSEENEKVAGFYTHIGKTTQVHHLWAYKSLQSRDQVRSAAWGKEGWNTCVANTVPLIRHMSSSIMIPTPFSPLQ